MDPRQGWEGSPANMKKFSKRAVVGGVIGTTVAVGGTALAAILLTTSISGQAEINEVATKNEVSVTASSIDGSKLDCSNVQVSPDFKTLTFNPVLTKPVGGSNAVPATVPVPGGKCTVVLAVNNTGDVPIRVSDQSRLDGPAGWTISGFGGSGLAPIAAGSSGTISATIEALQGATEGAFGGQIVYTD